jgi:hypothetical protein
MSILALEQTRRPDHDPGDTPAQGGGLLNSWFGLDGVGLNIAHGENRKRSLT